MDDITRVCRKCGQEKPLSEFVKDKTCALGYSHTCKQCNAERNRKWRAANPEKVLEYNRKWCAANPEKVLEYKRKRYAANPEKVREYKRKRYAANPEKVLEYNRKWREILSDGYLRYKLKQLNLPVTPETIEYKRIQLKLYREIKKQQNDERD
jgi:hypothetical protein